MATTPPPPSPSALRVPAAPRHGAGYDQFEPYPTRYSARLASQRAVRAAEKTPPPKSPSSPSKSRPKASPRKYRRVEEVETAEGETLSPPGTRSKPRTNIKLSEGRRFNDAPSLAHDSFDLSDPLNLHTSTHSPSHSGVNQPLPTPAKTPSKKKISHDLSSTSRTLFPTHSTMSAKKPTPFSLESFETTGPNKKDIQIYTDSRDRIPKPSDFQTPFAATNAESSDVSGSAYVSTKGTQGEPRTAIRHRKAVAGTADNKMTMIFRGKKVYKLDEDEDDDGDELGLFAARPDLLEGHQEVLNSVQPLSRGDIKPRMLFASKKTDKPLVEEDATDDEEHHEADSSRPTDSPVATPLHSEVPQAPGAVTGATRLTRSSARHGTQIEGTPTANIISDTKRKRNSPFDQWMRKKQSPEDAPASGQTTPQKREARAVSPTGHPVAKKTRSATRQTNPT